MRLTDNLISLYIRSILIPKAEDFSKPGYVFTKLTRDSEKIMLRDVFIPEEWVSELEVQTKKLYGDKGLEILYKIGKNGGYTYANFSGLETIETKPGKKDFEEYFRLLLLYIAGTYGADVDYEMDVTTKYSKQSYSNFVVCPKNGIGEIVITGSAAGIWAWMLQDKTVEGIHTECLGRGDKMCTVVLGPPEKIGVSGQGRKPFKVPELIDINLTEEYLTLNQPHPTENAKTSLESMINYKVIEFKDGSVTFHNKRFFEWDAHYIYFLEQLYTDQELLFDLTKQYYQKVGEEMGDKLSVDYISNFLGAMGWGDISIYSGPKVQVKHYPYTSLYQKTQYTLIRGILSGLLTTLHKEDVNLKKAEPVFDKDGFSVILS